MPKAKWCPEHELADNEEFTLEDWREEVAEGKTRLGYVEWVNEGINYYNEMPVIQLPGM